MRTERGHAHAWTWPAATLAGLTLLAGGAGAQQAAPSAPQAQQQAAPPTPQARQQAAPGQPAHQGQAPADGAPVLSRPVDSTMLGNGLPHRDQGAAPGDAARTGPETTSGTRLPPESQGAPSGSGTTHPGGNSALGRGS